MNGSPPWRIIKSNAHLELSSAASIMGVPTPSRESGIKLSSYDIALVVWNLDSQALNKPYYLELSLVGEILAYLQYLEANSTQAKMLDVPDMSRKVFDSPDKFEGLRFLKAEVEELAADIAKELQPIYSHNRELIQKSLAEAYVF